METIDLRNFGVDEKIYHIIESILDYFIENEDLKGLKRHKIIVNDKSILREAKKITYKEMLTLLEKLNKTNPNEITIYLLADEDPNKGYIITHIVVESKGKIVYAPNKR